LETEIPGLTNFKGTVVHPQFWPEKLNYEGQNVVIIGSGATAVTLLPALAQKAARTTMLQRSPSYVLNAPNEDGIDHIINTLAPRFLAKSLIRIKYLVIPWMIINFCYYYPSLARRLLRFLTIPQLPPTISHDPHFQPAYNPLEQRLCLCPDGDFFSALRSGKCDIVTGKIETMTSDTIKLTNGDELHPDIIVTATGLKVQVGGGMKVYVDCKPFNFGEKFMWKTSMIQDLPNAAYSLGYVNASWTLGADATAKLVCRILKKMEREKSAVIVPRVDSTRKMQQLPLMNLSSTYIQKAQAVIPKASNHLQWNSRSTYFRDIWEARFGDVSSDVEYIPFQTKP
jgi:cation diffusion facilitator CzcD-associated flavoprotein CzcO